jgi:tetratricopeptide (TPR) repeat protein
MSRFSKLLAQNPEKITPDDLTYFNNLASSYNELFDYEKAISVAAEGIEISKRFSEISDLNDLIMIYNNIGISYSRRNDYTTALLYLNQAMENALRNPSRNLHGYISVINSMTVYNERLGNREAALSLAYEAYPIALKSLKEQAFFLISNYARYHAENGDYGKAEEILENEKKRLRSAYGTSSRFYYEMMVRYSILTSRYLINNSESLRFLEEEAIPYCSRKPDDHSLLRDVHQAYALALMKEARCSESLRAIQKALFPSSKEVSSLFINPGTDEFIADRASLGVLSDKIGILHRLYNATHDTLFLSHAISTNMFLISSVEKVRIDISEEESRILLGDRFRSLYDGIITDLVRMYSITGGERYFNLAFEYAERSKAAGLLVSLREIKASQFLIPDSLAERERTLERDLGYIREQISVESARELPDRDKLASIRESEFSISSEKARLIELFESKYPEYYAAKYNTDVASIRDVLRITGRNGNYINYVYTDTVLYTFVINRKHRKILSTPTDIPRK